MNCPTPITSLSQEVLNYSGIFYNIDKVYTDQKDKYCLISNNGFTRSMFNTSVIIYKEEQINQQKCT